jgi:hypothetical protein
VRTMMRVVREKTISWTESSMQEWSFVSLVLLLLLSVRSEDVEDMALGVVVAIEV